MKKVTYNVCNDVTHRCHMALADSSVSSFPSSSFHHQLLHSTCRRKGKTRLITASLLKALRGFTTAAGRAHRCKGNVVVVGVVSLSSSSFR